MRNKSIKKLIDTNLTGILTVGSIVGTATTAGLAFQAGREIEQLEDGEKTVKNYAKIVAKPVLSGTATVTCICGLNYAHMKKYAALASLYAISQADLDLVKEKIEETFGKEANEKIEKEVKDEKLARGPIYVDGYKEQTFFDRVTGRYFSSTVHKIDESVAKINAIIASEGRANLNEFYRLIGLDPVECGDLIQWHRGDVYDALEVIYDTQMTRDYKAIMTIEYEFVNRFSW